MSEYWLKNTRLVSLASQVSIFEKGVDWRRCFTIERDLMKYNIMPIKYRHTLRGGFFNLRGMLKGVLPFL